MTLYDEIQAAQAQLALAEQQFDFAEPAYIDPAIWQLEACRQRLNTLYREVAHQAMHAETMRSVTACRDARETGTVTRHIGPSLAQEEE